ncbi:PREDICTED: uncharacterized protein LOC108571913 [Habropoda laboriosa]|uniref:uncharacterized protein LOC108571913 n=1 Tax=Habropoda laboriosa TaxID=597456 RepID=UPI00083CE950|nr:PREDICTED: uncharacterized protein LOC108571913 [Habropoda laboriosa]
MAQNKYVQVTIFEPVAKSSTESVHGYSAKTLSTIHECDSLKVSYVRNNAQKNVPSSVNSKSNVERFSSCEQSVDSPRNSDRHFDIDLLLRHYARNSNMEKSINKVLEQADEKCLNRSNDRSAKRIGQNVNEGPLIELDAVCRIYNSLKQSSSKSSLWSKVRFHDTLTTLQSFVRQFGNKTLEQILSSDPSMKMCERCGVISCSKSSYTSVESQKLQSEAPNFSRTRKLSDVLSNCDDYSQMYRDTKNCCPVKEETTKRIGRRRNRSNYKQNKDRGKTCVSREVIVKGKNQFCMNNPQENVEVMVAERENDNETRDVISGRSLKRDTVELQDYFRNSQITKQSGLAKSLKGIPIATIKNSRSQQIETNFKFEDKDTTLSGATANLTNNSLCDKYLDRTDCTAEFANNKRDKWKALSKGELSLNVCNEKIVKNISYEKSKSRLDDFIARNRVKNVENKHDRLRNVLDDTTPSISVMTCLARNRAESRGGEKKEFVSQLCERTCGHSRHHTDRRGFLLHNNKEKNSRVNSEFLTCDELPPSDKITKNVALPKNSQNYLQFCKHIEPIRNIKQFSSPTYLMEDDSLENCIKASDTLAQSNESNATIVSSSSAENLIREWIKAPRSSRESNIHDETCKKSGTSKLSVIGLNAEPRTFWNDKKCLYYVKKSIDEQYLQPHSAKKTWRSALSWSQLKLCHPSGPTVSKTAIKNSQKSIDHKIDTSNFKKIENCESKRCFKKQLLGWFKSATAIKSTKSKNVDANRESSGHSDSFSGDCSENITRRIIYNESSLKSIIDNNEKSQKIEDILLLYRKVLENTEKMDWQSFQRFVESLHPNKKDLWRDICEAINNEARRIADTNDKNTEVYIEITSTPFEELKQERRTRSKEIVFEMDITLGDIEKCLGRQLALTEKERLDTLKGASEFIKVRNDDVCDIEVVSNQAE